jgi:isopentenyl-diphosphate delta-isomerase
MITGADERVVLVDEAGNAIGTALKSDVHHQATPRHLAFSCYVFDADDRLLVTRRALTKQTFPGVWTNTVCGHPAPGEPLANAVARRVRQELGIGLHGLRLVLPDFRYRAVMDNGMVENELCPVFVASTTDQPVPDRAEIDAFDWVPWETFADEVLRQGRDVSLWCARQIASLAAIGAGPSQWPVRDPGELPAAARMSTA